MRCLNKAQRDNRQRMGQGYEPFDAGLWYMARGSFGDLVAVSQSSLARAELDVAVAGLREAERSMGAGDDDVRQAIQRH